MLAALGAGDPPDLAYATPRTCGIPKYVQDHKLVDLTKWARRDHWGTKLRPGMLQDYNSPFAIFASQKWGATPKNVKIYSVPDALAAVALIYNKTLLSKLGLTVPRSVGQLVSDVEVAKRHGYIPLGLGDADGFLGDDWYQSLVNARLPYDDLERELRVDNGFSFQRPPFYSASQRMYAWRADFTPNAIGLDAQQGVDEFFAGKTLFQLVSSSENPQITSLIQKEHLKIGVFGFPGQSTKAKPVMAQSGYEGWIVPKDGHAKSAAVTFINWVISRPAENFLISKGVIPSTMVTASQTRSAPAFLRNYLNVLQTSRPGVFLDAAPILNLNATMEANVQFLLQEPMAAEQPSFLPLALQDIYSARGVTTHTPPQIDCEF